MARLLQNRMNNCRLKRYARIMLGLCTFRKQSPSYMVQFWISVRIFPSSSTPCNHFRHEFLLRRFIGRESPQQGQQLPCITPADQHTPVLVRFIPIILPVVTRVSPPDQIRTHLSRQRRTLSLPSLAPQRGNIPGLHRCHLVPLSVEPVRRRRGYQ